LVACSLNDIVESSHGLSDLICRLFCVIPVTSHLFDRKRVYRPKHRTQSNDRLLF